MAHLVCQRVIAGLLLICVSIGALAQQVVAVPRSNPLSIMTLMVAALNGTAILPP